MSMNIYIDASREVTVNKTGKVSTQTITFSAWQTPTDVTYKILESADHKQAYIDYILLHSGDREMPVYADDDIFCCNGPIGTETYNSGKEHVAKLIEWITDAEEEGYEVEFSLC